MILEVKTTASYYNLDARMLVFPTPEALKKQIELLQDALNERTQRLEFFDDGIYFDGERLPLRGRYEAILRCFEILDRVPAIDLIYKVWGNSDVKESNVRSTISQFNKEMLRFNIYIEKEGEFFQIVKNL